MTEIHVGTSGFSYNYPQDLPSGRWFEYYMDSFHTVELNTTFYGLPAKKTYSVFRIFFRR